MTTDTALQATDAVFMAEQAVGRARRVVDELHTTIHSALRVLGEAELDSAKARLTDRGDRYLEAAGEHLGRFEHCLSDLPHRSYQLYGHLSLASGHLADASELLDPSDASDPLTVGHVAGLKSRIAVLEEVISLAKPIARLATRHVDNARHACHDVTPRSLLEPVTLERSIATAGKELGRADEDVRLLENVVDHAAVNARRSADIASEITDNARRRMAEQGLGQVPRQVAPADGSPAR